jgi:predicted HTH domain antitoxin
MQITVDLPDNLALNEADLRIELAIALFQRNILLIEQAAEMVGLDVDDFYLILVERKILTPQSNPDDTPDELILAHLRLGCKDAVEGNIIPIAQLWDEINLVKIER